MKWVFIIIGILVAVIALVALVGALLPKAHTGIRSARFKQPPETIWKAITDVDAFPSWREGVKSIERMPDRNGLPAWKETDTHGQVIPFETTESVPPRKLVARIADPKLPFGGTWTYEIAAIDGGSRLTITENGEIYNPIFRFMARFFFWYTATIATYLRSLGKKFGETVQIEGNGS
jgi:uncharacterized protein YndB with AHSA1/START domain